jgi:hypothetical protein
VLGQPKPASPGRLSGLRAALGPALRHPWLPWVWGDFPCASWPARAADRYAGPWNRPTANPILVVGNTGDPATASRGSVRMARLLARGRLLTVRGFGHTELLNPSRCVARREVAYFVSGELPPSGTVCRQDTAPFARRG